MSIPAFSQTTSLKNNLLYDATLTPNIGIEQKIDSLSTVQLFYGLNPWRLSDTKRLRHWSLMPEYRRWLPSRHSTNTTHPSPFAGHFIGIHALGGEFNIAGIGPTASIRDYHYEGWYVGGGLTYGYAWRLAEHWNLEAAIGLGYVHLAYDKYENEECGLLLDSRHKNYVGPTKLALNIAYLIGKKKPVELPPPPVVKEIYQPHYQLAYVTPQAEQEKTRHLSGRAFLDFVVDKTDIRPNYRGNAAELAKVLQTIDVVRRDTFTTITHISIHGYASPESPYQHNAYLAQARAEAFATYVQGLISLPKNLFTIKSTPEDWEGLIAHLDSLKNPIGSMSPMGPMSPMSLEAVKAIASSDDAPDAKERLLKKQYPREWRWMLDSIFPALRHSDYEVRYTVRPFTVEEASRIIREKPQHLSLNEMFLVANTYEPGSQDYNDVFEIAVRMYPDDETANLNAAVIALNKNDLTAAKRYLEKAGGSAAAQNARAVVAIRENRLDDADRLLRQLSLPEAAHNLRELELYRQSTE